VQKPCARCRRLANNASAKRSRNRKRERDAFLKERNTFLEERCGALAEKVAELKRELRRSQVLCDEPRLHARVSGRCHPLS
jgi:hypothetical protein